MNSTSIDESPERVVGHRGHKRSIRDVADVALVALTIKRGVCQSAVSAKVRQTSATFFIST